MNATLDIWETLSDAMQRRSGESLRDAAARTRVQQLLDAGIVVLGTAIPSGNVANVNIFVDGRGLNLGKSATRGLDFSASYDLDLSAEDTVTLGVNGTYLLDYNVAVSPQGALTSQLNRIFQPLKFKARATVEWDHGPFSARLLATHVGGYTNSAITPNQQVSSYTPIDLSLTVRIGEMMPETMLEGLALTAEVRNLLDVGPPFVNIAPGSNGSGGYDATAASPVGRMFALGARVAF